MNRPYSFLKIHLKILHGEIEVGEHKNESDENTHMGTSNDITWREIEVGEHKNESDENTHMGTSNKINQHATTTTNIYILYKEQIRCIF